MPAGHVADEPVHVAAAVPWPALHDGPRHTVPAFPAGAMHPVAGAQESTVHGLPSSHVTAEPPVHTPAEHVSPVVQALLSLQVVPFGLVGFEQTPPEQVPATWH